MPYSVVLWFVGICVAIGSLSRGLEYTGFIEVGRDGKAYWAGQLTPEPTPTQTPVPTPMPATAPEWVVELHERYSCDDGEVREYFLTWDGLWKSECHE